MKLTLDLLDALGACELGIDFAVRNKCIGRDVSELIKLKSKDTNLNWLRSNCTGDIVLDENDRVIQITGLYYEPFTRRYENDLLVYKSHGKFEEHITYLPNGDIKNTRTYGGHADGYAVYRNGIMIEGITFHDTPNRYQKTSNEIIGDEMVVNVHAVCESGTRLLSTTIYKNGVINKMITDEYTVFYDKNGNLIREEYTNGDVYTREYNDGNKCIASYKNGNLNTTAEYDERNRMVRSVNLQYTVSSVYTYDDNDNILVCTMTDSCGSYSNVYEYVKDDAGNLIDVIKKLIPRVDAI